MNGKWARLVTIISWENRWSFSVLYKLPPHFPKSAVSMHRLKNLEGNCPECRVGGGRWGTSFNSS